MELKPIPYYTRTNLELLLGNKKRTLDARILSLKKKSELIALKRGFYLNNGYYQQVSNKQTLLEYLSGILVSPSYISLEYALAEYGFIAESVYIITCVTTKKTRVIKNDLISYSYRNLAFSHYHSFETRNFNELSYSFATLEKAIWDLCYFASLPTLEHKHQFLLNSRFNWKILTGANKQILIHLFKSAKSAKMNSMLKILKDEGIV